WVAASFAAIGSIASLASANIKALTAFIRIQPFSLSIIAINWLTWLRSAQRDGSHELIVGTSSTKSVAILKNDCSRLKLLNEAGSELLAAAIGRGFGPSSTRTRSSDCSAATATLCPPRPRPPLYLALITLAL